MIHLIIPDSHSHYQHDNTRADYLGKLILDVKPDVVIHLGDSADLPSLSSYDKGKRSFQGRTYRADITTHIDFQERLWGPIRIAKKKLPRRVFLEGNHEHRIEKALDLSPELAGTISFGDLDLSRWYSDIVRYEGSTPGIINIDGVNYAHFFISGVMGRPIGGEHPATSLLAKQYESCTAGHLHLADWSVRSRPDGHKIMGCLAGSYLDYETDWAGKVNHLWWNGVVIKRNVSEGTYDPEFVSLGQLKGVYSV